MWIRKLYGGVQEGDSVKWFSSRSRSRRAMLAKRYVNQLLVLRAIPSHTKTGRRIMVPVNLGEQLSRRSSDKTEKLIRVVISEYIT